MEIRGKRGVLLNVVVPLLDKDNPHNFKTGFAASITTEGYRRTDAGTWQSFTASNLPWVQVGTLGTYYLQLTASEMSYDLIILKLSDASDLIADSLIIIRNDTVTIGELATSTALATAQTDLTTLKSDTTTLKSDTATLKNAKIHISGTADSGTTTTLVDNALTEVDDFFNGMMLLIYGGTNSGRLALITDFDAATDKITFSPAMPAAIDNTSQYMILRNHTMRLAKQ